MTNDQLKELFALMRDSGVTKLKMDALEIELGGLPKALGPAGEGKIEDKPEEQLTSLLKLSDDDILARMFPEPKNPGGSDDTASNA